MEITKTLYVKDRRAWRSWLEKNHGREKEIWLIYYKKHTDKQRVPYEDAVEEALCFGWIDSTVKTIDKDKYAQRFSPRNPKSSWSEPNKERLRRLIKMGKMTKAGLAKINDELLKELNSNKESQPLEIAPDILKNLKKDSKTWQNFQKFPQTYQIIRISFIEGARNRPQEFQKRLNYFLKMTRENKKFGMKIGNRG